MVGRLRSTVNCQRSTAGLTHRNLDNRVFCPYLRAVTRLLGKKTRFLTTRASRSKPSTVNSVQTQILHHSQEQAFLPVPQRVNFLVEQAEKPVHKKLIENGATSQFKQQLNAIEFQYLCTAVSSLLWW